MLFFVSALLVVLAGRDLALHPRILDWARPAGAERTTSLRRNARVANAAASCSPASSPGALLCAIGAPSAMYQQYANPESAFNLTIPFSALGNVADRRNRALGPGPIIGAILLSRRSSCSQVTRSPRKSNVLILGIMLVLFVVGAPEGIIGLIRKLRGNRKEGGT
jgi:branched-chain amino acid transport system permease protein